MEVLPLKYGTVFKRVFSDIAVFSQFAQDILGISLKIDKVYTEYQYPEPVGFVKSEYDLFAEDIENRIIVEIQHIKEADFFDRFLYYHLISLVEQVRGFHEYRFDRTVYTIVILTSTPQDNSVNFSCAVGDMNPIDEYGNRVNLFPHKLIFLAPKLTNEKTPPLIKKWLDFIADSLDGQIDNQQYPDDLFQNMLKNMEKFTLSPEELSEIKDAAAWELAKQQFKMEGIAEGKTEGKAEGKAEVMQEVALRGIKKGLDIETIAEISGLSPTIIKKLKQELM